MKPLEPDILFKIRCDQPLERSNGQVKVRERLELMVEAPRNDGDIARAPFF